jgi:hypothetical protein
MVFTSEGVLDGWVLESDDTSSIGGTLNAGAITFNLGDDALNRQFRSILSFNTSGLPDNAVIKKVMLKIKPQSLVGVNPFTTHGGLMVDVRKPFFGTSAGLAIFKPWLVNWRLVHLTPHLSITGTLPALEVRGIFSSI